MSLFSLIPRGGIIVFDTASRKRVDLSFQLSWAMAPLQCKYVSRPRWWRRNNENIMDALKFRLGDYNIVKPVTKPLQVEARS